MDNVRSSTPSFHDAISNALTYWEPRRIFYNLVLVAVVVCTLAFHWTQLSKPVVTWEAFISLFVLAVLANLCYCAAYVVDLFVQFSIFRQRWLARRWLLWMTGTLFACALADFWLLDEVLPALA